MLEETIEAIRQAENEADELIKEADRKAEKLRREAYAKAEKYKADRLGDAQAQSKLLMEEAKRQCAQSALAAAEDVEKEIQAIRQAAALKEEKAVELVIAALT